MVHIGRPILRKNTQHPPQIRASRNNRPKSASAVLEVAGLEHSQLRRIILPGGVLALGSYPFSTWLLGMSGGIETLAASAIFAIEILLAGVLISGIVRPVYYVYEGFFAIPGLTWLLYRWHRRRLRRLWERFSSSNDKIERALIAERLRDYPIMRAGAKPQSFVDRPTLLGNIIATYELYPSSRYGIDGITWWHHLVTLAPEAARESVAEQKSFASSLLLASASSVCVSVLHGLYLLGIAIGGEVPSIVLLRIPVSIYVAVVCMAVGAVGAVVFYALALGAHRGTATVFCALVDLAIEPFATWLQTVVPGERSLSDRSEDAKSYLVYLQKRDG